MGGPIAYKLECDNGYERSFEAYCDEPESDCNPETKLEAVKDYYASFAHQHSRTGRFFDLDALRRSLYTPLRANPRRKKDVKDSVLNQDLVDRYELDSYLERAYLPAKAEYVGEYTLNIDNAMTFTAVLIARQLKLSHDQVKHIIRSNDLAAAVVGTYFSNQENDWLLHGHNTLSALLDLSYKEISQRANMVRLGLSHHLNEALEDEKLCEVLDSWKDSDELKRVVVCVFKMGLWEKGLSGIYGRLREAKPDDIRACLQAHYDGDEVQFKGFLFRSLNTEKTKTAPFDKTGVRYEVNHALKAFPLKPENRVMLEKYSAVMNWLYDGFDEINPMDSQAEQVKARLNRGARLHAFLVNSKYREAVLSVYEMRPKNEVKVKGLRAALAYSSNVEVANFILGLKQILSLDKLCRFFDESDLYHASQALLDKRHTFEVVARLLELKNSQRLFNLLIDERGRFKLYIQELALFAHIESEDVVTYLLSNPSISAYFFEPGLEREKIKLIGACLEMVKFDVPSAKVALHKALAYSSFLKAGIALLHANLLNQENLSLLIENASLCSNIDQEKPDVDEKSLKIKLMFGRLQLDTKGLEVGYPSMMCFISQIKKHMYGVDKQKHALQSLIKLYQAIDYIIKAVASKGPGYVSVGGKLVKLLDDIERNFKLVEDEENLVEDTQAEVLSCLGEFSRDPHHIKALETLTVSHPNAALRQQSFFPGLVLSKEKVSIYLSDIISNSSQLMTYFGLKKSIFSQESTIFSTSNSEPNSISFMKRPPHIKLPAIHIQQQLPSTESQQLQN